MKKRIDNDCINNLKLAIKRFSNLTDETRTDSYLFSYENSTEKEFNIQMKGLLEEMDSLMKTTTDILDNVIIIYKPYFQTTKKINKDRLYENLVPVLFEIERFYDKSSKEEWNEFNDRNALLYMLTLISKKKFGYLESNEGIRKVTMFIKFRTSYARYFRRYDLTDSRWDIDRWEEKGYIICTRSPRTKSWNSRTHYALTDKGKKHLKKNTFDDLALRIIYGINLILELK